MTTNQTIDGVPRVGLDAWQQGRDGMRAERDSWMTKYQQMRELVEIACNGYAQEQGRALNELRALLDEPEKSEYLQSCEAAHLEILKHCKPAAQPHEPVAWLNVATGHVTTSAVVVMDWDDEKEQVQSLYAEQPAPVAVVLPDRLSWSGIAPAHIRNHVKGWNACLDELKRLNPSL